ncbi:dolichyl-phosphate-mannose--protein mannosyltransferase, partial [Janibacter anophelis]
MDRGTQLRERLLGFRPTDALWGWLGPILFAVIGGGLRFWSLDRPHQLVFDETYYVKQGVSMLDHGVEMRWNGDGEEVDPLFTQGTTAVFNTTDGDMVVHPPVGKWIIAFGEWVFGSTSSFGWRFSVALLGTLSILMVGRIARRLFGSNWLGAIAAFLMAFEGHHFVHSRTGLLDIILMFFAIAAFGALLIDRDWSRARLADKAAGLPTSFATGPMMWWRPWRLVAALSLGLACGTKWSGLYFFAAFGLMTVFWDIGARRAAGARHW